MQNIALVQEWWRKVHFVLQCLENLKNFVKMERLFGLFWQCLKILCGLWCVTITRVNEKVETSSEFFALTNFPQFFTNCGSHIVVFSVVQCICSVKSPSSSWCPQFHTKNGFFFSLSLVCTIHQKPTRAWVHVRTAFSFSFAETFPCR